VLAIEVVIVRTALERISGGSFLSNLTISLAKK
jgi:hypothetical protein